MVSPNRAIKASSLAWHSPDSTHYEWTGPGSACEAGASNSSGLTAQYIVTCAVFGHLDVRTGVHVEGSFHQHPGYVM